MGMRFLRLVSVAAAALLVTSANDLAAESFTATVVPDGHRLPQTFEGRTTGLPLHLTVSVDQWSARHRVRELQGLLQDGGQGALARVLHETPVGSVVPPAHISFGASARGVGPWNVVLASVEDTLSGRVALLVTEGPTDPFGSQPEPSATAPQFGAIRLVLDGSGHGSGELFPLVTFLLQPDGSVALAPATEVARRYQLLAVREWKK